MPRYITPVLAALLLAFALSHVRAQQSPSPQGFAQEAAISNAFELKAAELVVQRGKDPRAIAFAEEMLRDHGRLSLELRDAAQKDGIPLPDGLDDRRQKQFDALQAATEADFDQAYLSTQITAHEDAVAQFDAFSKSDHAP